MEEQAVLSRTDTRKVMMKRRRQGVCLILGLSLTVLLVGCPGMPGAPGGQGGQQNLPPGLQPPPGEKSGGVRTLMGATITAPDNAVLLVRFSHEETAAPAQWQSCRRVIPLESTVIAEGLNFDGRDKSADKDVNQLLPITGLNFQWKYEPKPAPPPQPKGKDAAAGAKQGRVPPRRGR